MMYFIFSRFRWQLQNLYENVRGSFDNDVTPWFALVICLWGKSVYRNDPTGKGI